MVRKKFIPPLANKDLLPKPVVIATKASSSQTINKQANDKEIDNNDSTTTQDSSQKPTSSGAKPSDSLKRKFKPPTMINSSKLPPNTTSSKNQSSSTTKNDDKESADGEETGEVWSVMYCKTSNKKHKSYDDGVLLVLKKRYILHDSNGKVVINRLVPNTLNDLREGHVIVIGTKECEMMNKIDYEEYSSGRVFLPTSMKKPLSKESSSRVKKPSPATASKFKAHDANSVQTGGLGVNNAKKNVKVPQGSYVLNTGHPETDSNGKYMYPVYIDSHLSQLLRPHQVEGIQFMYDCIMGIKNTGYGCLLADEMGLGKTLQSIALIWTLLSRGPYYSPVLKKVIIVTNSSLVQNWRREIQKWLGDERVKPMCCTAKAGKKGPEDTISEFATGHKQVMIISYNLCTNYASLLKDTKCDLLICDEGHKLKNSNNQIFKALKQVGTPKRIVLSGTPIQNDLAEFYCIADFLNPGILGEPAGFKSLFTDPINLSREPSATASQKSMGMRRFQELTRIINSFVLRRTNDVLKAHLPPKHEFVVFCQMAELQETLYSKFLKSKYMAKMFVGQNGSISTQNALSCIQNLKKLLTHPDMIYKKLSDENYEEGDDDSMDNFRDQWGHCLDCFPEEYSMDPFDPTVSGKMKILDRVLKKVKKTGDRIVVVSNFTSILNQIESLCSLRDYKWVRLDGSTASDKRMQIVESYNNPKSNDFIFLLSSKAGGAGLNIIGANRLILFDPDWNPSNDLQAMARVWRDGQKKDVFIYRFVTTGTIEEKIFQRQIVKTGLSKTVVDEKTTKAAFSKDMLKQLFNYKPDHSICETFSKEAESGDNIDKVQIVDPVLYKAVHEQGIVSFVKIQDDNDDHKLLLDVSEGISDEDKEAMDTEEGEDEYEFGNETADDTSEDDEYQSETEEEERPTKRSRKK